MIKNFFEFMASILRPETLHETLDAHIAAGNPQTAEDIERLEREFFQKRQSLFFDRYY